jgi:hypothetical protein
MFYGPLSLAAGDGMELEWRVNSKILGSVHKVDRPRGKIVL